MKKETGDISIIYYLTQYIQMLTFKYVINAELLNRYFPYYSYCYWNMMCIVYSQHISGSTSHIPYALQSYVASRCPIRKYGSTVQNLCGCLVNNKTKKK